jgi:hypothetical protein
LLQLNEFLALENNVAALVTVLLLLFFSPPGLGSSLALRPKNPPGGENFFWDTVASSVLTVRDGVLMASECGIVSSLSLGGLEEPLNILFSNPPWLEKLLLLLPASLMGSPLGRREVQ